MDRADAVEIGEREDLESSARGAGSRASRRARSRRSSSSGREVVATGSGDTSVGLDIAHALEVRKREDVEHLGAGSRRVNEAIRGDAGPSTPVSLRWSLG